MTTATAKKTAGTVKIKSPIAAPAMVATLTGRTNKFMTSFRKEDKFSRGFYALVPAPEWMPGEVRAVVDLRLYWAGSTCYAAVWVRCKDESQDHRRGTGKAGGCGYDKASAAAHDALTNAGVDVPGWMHGSGETAIRQAVMAVAVAAGWPEARFFQAHG